MSGRASSAMTLPRLTPAGVAQRKSGALIRRWSAVQFSPPAPIDNPAVVQWPERLTVDQVTAVRLRPPGPILAGNQRRHLTRTKTARPTAAQLSQAQIARLQNRDRRFQSPARPWTVARHETVRWERWGELRPLELAGDNLAQFLFNCVISPIPSQTIRALAPHK